MTTATTAAAGSCGIPPATGERVWTPRPWRAECRRTDLRRVGRFAHERALRDAGLNLSPGAHHVVSVLASYGNEHGTNIFPSQQTLARVCRRSARHVRGKLRELTELGLVRRLSHGGGRPSYRNGRKRRVTPARYELTLPTCLTGDTANADDDAVRSQASNPGSAPNGSAPRRRPANQRGEGAAGRHPAPKPEDRNSGGGPHGQPAHQRPGPANIPAPAETDGELSPQVVEQIREALGVRTLTGQQADTVIAAAVARAPGPVTNRLSYALAVIRSDPATFRPTPDVTEPDCPHHPDHPATCCPLCAAAKSDPTPAWRRMREALRQPRAP